MDWMGFEQASFPPKLTGQENRMLTG
jgi:hypothetical protein